MWDEGQFTSRDGSDPRYTWIWCDFFSPACEKSQITSSVTLEGRTLGK